jgi:hypothetical protein
VLVIVGERRNAAASLARAERYLGPRPKRAGARRRDCAPDRTRAGDLPWSRTAFLA